MSSWRRLVSVLLPIFGLVDQTLASASSTPVPLLNILPSESWNGNDGNWSSFWLNVGTPAEFKQVFISTASNQPWVISPDGCPSSDPNCVSRGFSFASSSSSTWVDNTISSGGVFALQVEGNLGLTGNGEYGTDTIGIGLPSSGTPALTSQVLATIDTPNFWLGMFGLNPVPTNFSSKSAPVSSYMSNLKSQGHIPSLSYGYAAGAYYRFDGVFGNLTLGGYDKSLFVPNDLSINFATDGSDLTLVVNTITTSGGVASQVLSPSSSSFPAFIDSSIPYLYLPTSVCEQFEKAFGITYDTTSQLYLVSDSQHTDLVNKNASVIFTLTNSTSQAMVNITLPYAAFDLMANTPLVNSSTRYFPLKRAKDNTQTTLGRAFLQEAYLIADYERSQFSIHQRDWSKAYPVSQPIIIQPATTSKPSSSSKFSPGIIAVIVLAVLLSIALTLALSIFFLRRHQQKLSRNRNNNNNNNNDNDGSTTLDRDLEHKSSVHSTTSTIPALKPAIIPIPRFKSKRNTPKEKEKPKTKPPKIKIRDKEKNRASDLSFFDSSTNSILLNPSHHPSLTSLGIGKALGSPNLSPHYSNTPSSHNNPTSHPSSISRSASPLGQQLPLDDENSNTEPKTFHLASLSMRRKERKKKAHKQQKEIYELSGSEVWGGGADQDAYSIYTRSSRSGADSPRSQYSFGGGSEVGLISPPLMGYAGREREIRGSESILHMGFRDTDSIRSASPAPAPLTLPMNDEDNNHENNNHPYDSPPISHSFPSPSQSHEIENPFAFAVPHQNPFIHTHGFQNGNPNRYTAQSTISQAQMESDSPAGEGGTAGTWEWERFMGALTLEGRKDASGTERRVEVRDVGEDLDGEMGGGGMSGLAKRGSERGVVVGVGEGRGAGGIGGGGGGTYLGSVNENAAAAGDGDGGGIWGNIGGGHAGRGL